MSGQLLIHYLYFSFISSLVDTPVLTSEVAKKPGINDQYYPELSDPEPPLRGPCGHSSIECPGLKSTRARFLLLARACCNPDQKSRYCEETRQFWLRW